MNQNPGIIGTKLGMTQIFAEDGTIVPCTVVRGGCVVVGKRTAERDGYSALVLGLGERKPKHASRAQVRAFEKVGQSPKKTVRELRASVEHVARFEVGQPLKVEEIFEQGQLVDVQGKSKGRGFSGVIRRWNFAAPVFTHGTHEYKRHGGSIGTNMTPGRTLPGLKMPGHYGNELVSTLSQRIAKLVPEDQLVLIEGAVPGPTGAIVRVQGAVKKRGGKKGAGKNA
ncbi:MAG: 50S ribosomal protein L3 [Deltaproteobacteria bacterium]|nr:50S ribosomal protein L3 [Deltaproteobacteria bacterium]